MPNQFICKTLRSLFVTATAAILSASIAQTDPISNRGDFDSIKPAEWTGNLLPSIGSALAPIKVVFFVDYQCPSCRSADPVVRLAVSKRSDVALIYRDFPLAMHKLAIPAAVVVENARAHGTFDLAHKRLMEGQSLTQSAIDDAAQKAGVSTKETAQARARIGSDHNLEMKSGIRYVPSFIVIQNGTSTLMSKQQILDFLK